VFKTAADPYVSKLTFLRCSQARRSQGSAFNANRGEDERIGQILLLHGKDQEPVGELKAGEIGAVAKLAVTHTGDTLSTRDRPLTLEAIPFPEPTLVVAIEPQTKADLDKMGSALQRMLEEEPSARVERSAAGEQILVAVGEAHVAVISERLKRKFGAAIVTRTPRVPYKETIRGKTQAHGRYKKQTGGHGMFGDVWIELEPNPGAGLEFTEKVVGGSVPRQFFPGVEKGVRETAAECSPATRSSTSTLYDSRSTSFGRLSFKIPASMASRVGASGSAGAPPHRSPDVKCACRAVYGRRSATSAIAEACSGRSAGDGMRESAQVRSQDIRLRDRAALDDRRRGSFRAITLRSPRRRSSPTTKERSDACLARPSEPRPIARQAGGQRGRATLVERFPDGPLAPAVRSRHRRGRMPPTRSQAAPEAERRRSSRSGPTIAPSRSIAVAAKRSTPTSARARSAASTGTPRAPSRHPSPSARPSRTSSATSTRSDPYRATSRPTNPGSSSAAVPTTTRRAPAAKAPATASRSRRPPAT
jgi:hypothetical protein